MKFWYDRPLSPSIICSASLVPSVQVAIVCVSPRVNSAEPWARGRKCVSATIGRICVVVRRSEEHTSELKSLMRISYAVFCLKKKKDDIRTTYETPTNAET